MKRFFLIFTCIFVFIRPLAADDDINKYFIDAYYIGQERIANAPNVAIEKWTYREYMTEYYTKGRIYKIEIDIYKNNNSDPVEKIIMENGKSGGMIILFEDVTIVGREIPYQKLIAYYTYYLLDDNTLGHTVSLYDTDNIGSTTKVLTLFLMEQGEF
jgi:hypothetical protein